MCYYRPDLWIYDQFEMISLQNNAQLSLFFTVNELLSTRYCQRDTFNSLSLTRYLYFQRVTFNALLSMRYFQLVIVNA